MKADLNLHGIEALLAGYGMELENDVVLDFGAPLGIDVLTATAQAELPFPQVPAFRAPSGPGFLDTRFGPFFRLDAATFPFVSSIVLHPERQPGLPSAALHAVAKSSARAIRLMGPTVDLSPFQSWEGGMRQAKAAHEAFGEHIVAAVAEGPLRSAFATGNSSVSVHDAHVGASRVFLVASTQFFANPFARAATPPDVGSPSPSQPVGKSRVPDQDLASLSGGFLSEHIVNTLLVFKNTLDWMIESPSFAAEASLPHSAPPAVHAFSRATTALNVACDSAERQDVEARLHAVHARFAELRAAFAAASVPSQRN